MNSYCLQIKSLNKPIAKNNAIEELNLNIDQGKKIALLGLNGAGKSSLMRLLVGENKADSGEILYQENYLENIPSKSVLKNTQINLQPTDINFKRFLGYQADTMLAIDEMSSQQYLELCGHLKGLSPAVINERIKLISQQWELENILDKKMNELSKGNLQKLVISQVFINQPKWLFFDEPCQSLDPLEQERFNRNIKNLEDYNLCVFSTHNVKHAIDIADKIILYHQSKIIYIFDLEKENNRYLLMIKNNDMVFDDLAKCLNITINSIEKQLYLFENVSSDKYQKIEKHLKQQQQDYEFFLPEKQAIMPLFRLLASGEFQLTHSLNNEANQS